MSNNIHQPFKQGQTSQRVLKGQAIVDDPERGLDPRNVHPTVTPTQPAYLSTASQRERLLANIERTKLPHHHVRQDNLWPFLVIRSFLSDDGRRPRLERILHVASPDIVVVAGDVPSYDGTGATNDPQPGVAHSVFVQVWNLGRLAAVGVKLSVGVSDSAQQAPPIFFTSMYLDLPDRRQPNCHQIFKLPKLWTPTPTSGNLSLVAKVSCFTDLNDDADLNPNDNRHIAWHRFGATLP